MFDAINHELSQFSEELASREQLVVLSKADASSSPERIAEYVEKFKARGLDVHVISSVTGEGIPELIEKLARRVFLEVASG